MAKLVFKGQNMTPPYVSWAFRRLKCYPWYESDCWLCMYHRNLSTIQSYYQPFINSLRNPRALLSQASSQVSNVASTYSPEALLNSIRNVNRQQLATVGVVGAEVIGFFTVGTMIGRMKVVGYRGEPEHGHHWKIIQTHIESTPDEPSEEKGTDSGRSDEACTLGLVDAICYIRRITDSITIQFLLSSNCAYQRCTLPWLTERVGGPDRSYRLILMSPGTDDRRPRPPVNSASRTFYPLMWHRAPIHQLAIELPLRPFTCLCEERISRIVPMPPRIETAASPVPISPIMTLSRNIAASCLQCSSWHRKRFWICM